MIVFALNFLRVFFSISKTVQIFQRQSQFQILCTLCEQKNYTANGWKQYALMKNNMATKKYEMNAKKITSEKHIKLGKNYINEC